MNRKEHILAALREQFESWQQLLSDLSEEEITIPQFDLGWSVKDVMAHLWAWQQISIARLQAGVEDREPSYPVWITGVGAHWEEDADRVNAATFENNHGKPWSEVYENWSNGFLRLLDFGQQLSELNLLDGDRYPWLQGFSLASILIASYDHHQEHLETLMDWTQAAGN